MRRAWMVWMSLMMVLLPHSSWAQTISCGDRVGVTYAGDGINFRSSPCGTILRQIRAGSEGMVSSSSCSQTCPLGGVYYRFWNVMLWNDDRPGWIADGTSSQRWLEPMPGVGRYPNVSAPGDYPVRVYRDVGSVGLRLRLGPGTNYPVLELPRRYEGATGTAYVVHVNRSEGLV